MFLNRRDAGLQLAKMLDTYRSQPNCLVIGLPRGGVVTAAAVAEKLELPLDVTCPRKIGTPFNPEYAIGAITETGEGFFNRQAIRHLQVDDTYLKTEMANQQKEAQRRLKVYRQNRPLMHLEGRTVLLVDDGIATGATMKAAIRSIKECGVARIIVAVPVIPPDTVREIEQQVDELTYLMDPPYFSAVGQFYEDFDSTTDEEVIQCLQENFERQKRPFA